MATPPPIPVDPSCSRLTNSDWIRSGCRPSRAPALTDSSSNNSAVCDDYVDRDIYQVQKIRNFHGDRIYGFNVNQGAQSVADAGFGQEYCGRSGSGSILVTAPRREENRHMRRRGDFLDARSSQRVLDLYKLGRGMLRDGVDPSSAERIDVAFGLNRALKLPPGMKSSSISRPTPSTQPSRERSTKATIQQTCPTGPCWAMYGRRPRCKKNMTFSRSVRVQDYPACFRMENWSPLRRSRYGRWPW